MQRINIVTYRKKLTFIATVFLILTGGCSSLDRALYKKSIRHPDINQGNYFSLKEISKICIGMKKRQVVSVLGTPLMTDPFGTNTWFYIHRQSCHGKIIQRTLVLTFNNKDTLTTICRKSLRINK